MMFPFSSWPEELIFRSDSPPKLSRGQSRVVDSAAKRRCRRPQAGEVLSVESAKGCLNRLADSDNAVFDRRTEERDPKLIAKQQARPTRGSGTTGMGGAIKFHAFHCRHCRMQNMVRVRFDPCFHSTLKTQLASAARVFQKKPMGYFDSIPAKAIPPSWKRLSPPTIRFSPIFRFAARLIVDLAHGWHCSEPMALLAPIDLPAAEKLEILQRLDRYRKWHSLDDKRYCLACGQIIAGHRISVIGGTRGTGPLRLVCPSRGCHSIPMDWVIPNDKVLARMSMLEETESLPAKPVAHSREPFAARLRRFATHFRPAA